MGLGQENIYSGYEAWRGIEVKLVASSGPQDRRYCQWCLALASKAVSHGDGVAGLWFNCARFSLMLFKFQHQPQPVEHLSSTSAAGRMPRTFRRRGRQERPNSEQGPANGDHAISLAAYSACLGRHGTGERGPADQQRITKIQRQCSVGRFKPGIKIRDINRPTDALRSFPRTKCRTSP